MIDKLTAGDTLEFLTEVADYPPADGWVLKFRLVPRVSGTPIDITATTSGTDYLVQVGPAVTVTWVAGEYFWTSWVEKAGARYTVESGLATIKANPATLTLFDGRTHARKVLEAIEAVIEGRATKDQQEYTIGDRSLKRTPIADLLVLRDKYRTEVANEDAQAQVAAGGPNPRFIRMRFNRA